MSREKTDFGRMVSRELDRLMEYQGLHEDLLPDWREKYDDVSDMHLAAFYGDLPSIKRFLTMSETDVDIRTTHGPKLLIQRRGLKRAYFGRSLGGFFLGSTPLMLACQQGHLDVVQHLVKYRHANVNATDSLGLTPLSFAVANNHRDIIKYLLSQQAKKNTPEIRFGMTPIILATVNNHIDVVKLLLKQNADGLITDRVGRRPVHFAAWNYNSELVECFTELDNDEMGVHATDHNGNTTLHMLVTNRLLPNNIAIQQTESNHGKLRLGKSKNSDTENAEHSALINPKENVAADNKESPRATSNTLAPEIQNVSSGLNKDQKYNSTEHSNVDQQVPIIRISKHDMKTHKRQSVKLGFPRFSDSLQRGSGVPHEQYDCLKRLIDLGVDINAQNNQGETVLHKLCANIATIEFASGYLVIDDFEKTQNQLIMLALLLLYGCDPDIDDNTGNTAAMLCEKRGNWLGVEMLEKSKGISGTIATRHTDIKSIMHHYGWGRLVEKKRFTEDVKIMASSLYHGNENIKNYKLARGLMQETLSVLA